jgi:Uma2 family endonuclease
VLHGVLEISYTEGRMTIATKLMTAEEFARLPGHERAELIDGEVRFEMPPSPSHGMIAFKLALKLGVWLAQTKAGIAGIEGGFLVQRNPDRVRGPDVWFIRAERAPQTPPEGFWEIAPDFVVEIVSSSDTAEIIKEKLQDHFGVGVRLAWVMYPRFKQVEAHAPDGTMRTFHATDTLEAEDVLPGFRCVVAELLE